MMELSFDFPLILQRILLLASQFEHMDIFHDCRHLNSVANTLENKVSMLGKERLYLDQGNFKIVYIP